MSKMAEHLGKLKRKGKIRGKGKFSKVMHEFKHGTLHSGSKAGPVVRNPAQAKAIAISETAKAASGGYK